MGQKWSTADTDKYMERTISELENQVQQAETALNIHFEIETNHRNIRASKRRSQSQPSKKKESKSKVQPQL